MLICLGRLVLLMACLTGFAVNANASRNHIRVVLDLSQSMQANDPGGMAILSTMLLYDLSNPNIGQHDSFSVIPFDTNWNWRSPNQSPPLKTGDIFKAEASKRSEFIADLANLEYEADCTYFYPGLLKAFTELQAQDPKDTRTIVLITDGVPDDICHTGGQKVQAKEEALIKNLAVKMKAKNIRLYVLAFGPVAKTNEAYFKAMTLGDTIGRFFPEENGESLLHGMLQLFEYSMGYDVVGPTDVSSTRWLQLNPAGNMPRAAVVVFNPKTQATSASKPTIDLKVPSRPTDNPNLDGNGYFSEIAPDTYGPSGAAYALGWVLTPENGDYVFSAKPSQGTVAILRPNKVTLTISPHPVGHSNDVMAQSELPLRLDVANEFGGSPGDGLDIQLLWYAPVIGMIRDINQHVGPIPFPSPPPPLKPGGKVFKVPFQFPENPNDPAKSYTASIEATASKGQKHLGELVSPYKVNVHPYLKISPNPPSANVGSPLSKANPRDCKKFNFDISGHLPVPKGKGNRYEIKASLVVDDFNVIDHEFLGLNVTLEGEKLQFSDKRSEQSPSSSSAQAPSAGDWYKGKKLTAADITKEHEVCIKIGNPRCPLLDYSCIDPNKKIDLKIKFELAQAPYDKFIDNAGDGVIQPFTYQVTVDKPPFQLDDYLILISLGILTALLLWYLRYRPTLASDLGVALASENSSTPFVSYPLGEPSIIRYLLGLTLEKPILAPGNGAVLARVCPLDKELYQLRLPPNARLEIANPRTEVVASEKDLVDVEINLVYLLLSPEGVYRLRLEFR